jgi:hypothetical protein
MFSLEHEYNIGKTNFRTFRIYVKFLKLPFFFYYSFSSITIANVFSFGRQTNVDVVCSHMDLQSGHV